MILMGLFWLVVLVYFNGFCGGLLIMVVLFWVFFCYGLWLPQWWWWWLMVVVLDFLWWVMAATVVLVVVLVCGFLVVRFVFFFSSSGGGRLQGLVAMDVVSDRSYGNNVVVVE